MQLLSTTVAFAALLGSTVAAPLAQAEDCTKVVCGAVGYDRDQGNLWYDDTGADSQYEQCYNRCQATENCESFGFGGEACILFNVTLIDNFTPVSSSIYTFYDKSCEFESSLEKRTVKKHKANSTATATIATAHATATIAVPSGCTNVAPQVTITSFEWFNSTHNLDCANANYPADAEVCWNADSNTLCDAGSDGCTCTPYCYTGLPSAAYQPLGYGPPDTISVGINGESSTCSAANAQSYRNFEIGAGHFACGSAADIMGFYGNSNHGQTKKVTFYYNMVENWCTAADGAPRYEGEFHIKCHHDSGKNATCTIERDIVLNLTGWA